MDDVPMIVEVVLAVLGQHGFRDINTASDGAAALSRASHSAYIPALRIPTSSCALKKELATQQTHANQGSKRGVLIYGLTQLRRYVSTQ